MINALHNRSLHEPSSAHQTQANPRGGVTATRTDNGRRPEPNAIQSPTPEEVSPVPQRENTGGAASAPVHPDEVAYDSLVSRVEKAREAAEESAEEKMISAASPTEPVTQTEPLAMEVEKGVRLARTAHQVVASYLLTFQDDSLSADLSQGRSNKVNVRA
ncbi:MAG: hypothetical protein HQM02_07510 [Magnetococcales bacterium]|nr:hypothetical protein [Magnetococcales bacterium]